MGTTQDNPAVATPSTFTAEEQHDRDNARRLAERYRVPFIDLREQRIDPELFRTIPADLMFRYNFVPLEQHNNVLAIAAADPSLVLLSDELALLLGKKLAPRVATAKQIGDLLKRTEQSQRVLEQATEAFTLQVTKVEEDTEETISGDRLTRDTTGSPVVKLVETVIFTALERRASDIHIEARDAVGFSQEEMARFRRYIREPYGMVLVTGPTGSGKTTTLYAAINEIKSDEDKIITIEDPVEYQLRGITQIPVNEKKGLTFARGLRSILRHDPDKIMVGEIRDMETAQIAINSALTGHLVFTTVHANNVVDVLGRFLNMGVEAYQFVSALNCVLAQRLVRNICNHCKRPAKGSKALLEESGLGTALEHTHTFYEGIGCIECGGTGYKGRTAICELLDLSDHIREMILEKRPTSEIKKAAREEGMRFLRESAVEQVMAGITTLKEINKVTFVE